MTTTTLTLRQARDYTAAHLSDAAMELATAEHTAHEARAVYGDQDSEAMRRARWHLSVASAHALIGQGYAALAAAGPGADSRWRGIRGRREQFSDEEHR